MQTNVFLAEGGYACMRGEQSIGKICTDAAMGFSHWCVLQPLGLTQSCVDVDSHWMCAVVLNGTTAYCLYVTKKRKNVAAYLLRAYKQYSWNDSL